MMVRGPSRLGRTGVAICACVLSWATLRVLAEIPGGGPSDEPFFDATTRQVEYAGPGRDDAAPVDPSEVRIGYFGPSDPDHAEGGDLWLASALAVEEANRDGGYRGIPFRLVPAWSDSPWGTGVTRLARVVYEDGAWAIVGSIDGASTHLAEQIVAKARLTLVAPGGTDKTVNLANVAWMFSCLPADDRQAELLASALSREAFGRPLTLITGTDHDSRAATAELLDALDRRSLRPARHVEIEPGTEDPVRLATRVGALRGGVVVILAGATASARIVSALRAVRDDTLIVGGPAMGRRIFRETAGEAADGVLFPLLCDPAFRTDPFARAFESRAGRSPDCAAVQAYDATRLLIEAIRKAGLNRARIRDAVQALSPWSGIAGAVEWNPVGQNVRELRLATISDGRVVPVGAAGPLSRPVVEVHDPAPEPGRPGQ